MNGNLEPILWKNITFCPASSRSSHVRAPRNPVEKFSMLRTVLRSRGTEVPPDVMTTYRKPGNTELIACSAFERLESIFKGIFYYLFI